MGALSDLIASSPDTTGALLSRWVEAARQQLPEATEGVSYAVPCLLHRGKPVIGFRVGTNDCSLYPFSAAVVAAAVEAWPELRTTKGSIHFRVDQPLSTELIDLVVGLRIADIERR